MDYLDIVKDDFFKDTYTKIEYLKRDFPVNHGFLHINNVIENAKKIAQEFKLSDGDRRLLFCAAALHDVGYLIEDRFSHAKNGGIVANEFLLKKGVPEEDRKKICDAISHHGGKTEEDFSDMISICLILADKIDFVASRYSNDIVKYPKVIPFLNILSTEIKLKGNNLRVLVTTTKQFEEYKDKCAHIESVQNCLDLFSKVTGIENSIEYIIKD